MIKQFTRSLRFSQSVEAKRPPQFCTDAPELLQARLIREGQLICNPDQSENSPDGRGEEEPIKGEASFPIIITVIGIKVNSSGVVKTSKNSSMKPHCGRHSAVRPAGSNGLHMLDYYVTQDERSINK